MKLFGFSAAIVAALTVALPAQSAETVKFGKTCVSTPNNAKDVCVSFDGKTVSSTYKHQGKYPTKGTHTGCSVKGDSLTCTGGGWRTDSASGKMSAVTIKLSKGKPVSMAWR